MGTTIIKNRQFWSKFSQNWLTPKGKPHSSTPRMGNTSVLSCNWSIPKFVGQYQHTLKLQFMKSYIGYQAIMASKGWYISKFSGKNTLFGIERSNSKAALPVNYFCGFLGKNIKNCPPSKLFLFTSLSCSIGNWCAIWHWLKDLQSTLSTIYFSEYHEIFHPWLPAACGNLP